MEKVKIIRSGRRTVGLEITGDLQVLVRAPYRMPDREIQKFLKEKEAWIRKHLQKARERQEQRSKEPGLTERELKELTDRAVQTIPERVS